MLSLPVESICPVAHNEEKAKSTSLCFLCSYVKMDVYMSKDEKINVLVKPNEQCRACSYIVMARKERLTRSLVNFSTRQLVNHCNLFSKNFNIMSALFATNRSPCRKKSILAKVCFDANKG